MKPRPPADLSRPFVRWWNELPLPVRASLGWVWRHRAVRYLLIAVVVIFLGSLLANVLGLANTILQPIARIITAVVTAAIETPVGRIVSLNLLLVAVVLIVARKARAQARYLMAARAADRYFSALKHLVHRRFALARRDLESVIDAARFIDLSTAVAGFPELVEDASLKLAFAHAQTGEYGAGLRVLETVPRQRLSGALRRAFEEVHALLYDASPDFLDDTKIAELEKALASDPDNVRLLGAIVARKSSAKDYQGACESQRRLLKVLGRKATDRDRRHLAWLHYRRALHLVGDRTPAAADDLRRAHAELDRGIKAYGDLSLCHLLKGDLHWQAGETPQALAAWGRHPSPQGLDRLRRLLEADPRSSRSLYPEIVAAFPTAGALLVIAEHAHARGDDPLAERILVRLAELEIATPRQRLLEGDVLAALGRPDEAERAYRQGVELFLASE